MYKISKILVPLDFSACSRSALAHAISLGAQLGASIHAVYVSDVPQFKREPPMYKISKILVPLDFSACSRSALAHAIALGTQLGATIHALYVSDVPQFRREPRVASERGTTSLREFALEDAQAELNAFLDTLDPGERSKISTSLDVGSPRVCILDHAKRGSYDLIVMGTHGRTGRAHSLAGSVAESVVRSAPCPVLTVREPS